MGSSPPTRSSTPLQFFIYIAHLLTETSLIFQENF